MRLDIVAARNLPEFSRTQLKKWILEGRVLVNNEIHSPKDFVHSGDEIEINPNKEVKVSWEPEDIDFEICYEEEDFLIINKPFGLVMHPGSGCFNGTLANGLIAKYPQLINLPRSGIVHRLDKDTSGVFIIAKNRETAQLLTSLFRLRKVHKTYLAICNGELEKNSGQWSEELIRYENGKKIVEKAQTTFKVLDKNSNSSLVEMKPITGRKHQLRKQLFNIGHSIFGDKKYRSSTSDKGINKNLMLHSYQIRFMIKDKRYTYRALIPDYFKKLLKTKRLNFVGLK